MPLGPKSSAAAADPLAGGTRFGAATTAMPELTAGTLLQGKYRLERCLGQGGMGTVYAAVDELSETRCALKTLRPELSGDAEARRRFLQEFRISLALHHPSIVRVYTIEQSDGMLFFTMELLEGETLRSLLTRMGRLDLPRTVGILSSLSEALDYAHRVTVHRDVKPENVFVLSDGSVKLTDFGIAKALQDARSHTQTSASLGTAYYMSPEQVRGAAEVDGRSDLYALGVMLYEMLTGEVPLPGAELPSELRAELPVEVDRLFQRLVVRVDKRLGTAEELVQALVLVSAAEHEQKVAQQRAEAERQAAQRAEAERQAAQRERKVAQQRAEVERVAAQKRAQLEAETRWKEAGWVQLPAGRFLMGSPLDEPDRHSDEVLHEVELSRGFSMKPTPVTKAEWLALMGSLPQSDEYDDDEDADVEIQAILGSGECQDLDDDEEYLEADDDEELSTENAEPVCDVSWYDAVLYCNALSRRFGLPECYELRNTRGAPGQKEVHWRRELNGIRLPTEAEWEYACRAGTTGPYAGGGLKKKGWFGGVRLDEEYLTQLARFSANTRIGGDLTVGEQQPNNWGLYDMHGTVWEWVWDWLGGYPASREKDPVGPSVGRERVQRGGSWNNSAAECRAAIRTSSPPRFRSPLVGFRPVRTS
jgi:serine/threonine protein kinase